MKIPVWMFAVAGLAIALPTLAQVPAVSRATAPSAISTAVSDTELLIYRFPGTFDDGSAAGAGTATAVSCTNYSGSNETVRFAARNFDSTLRANVTFNLGNLRTVTAVSHFTNLYVPDVVLATGVMDQGTIAVGATTTEIVCTANMVNAASATPTGFDLHGIRYNPSPGSAE